MGFVPCSSASACYTLDGNGMRVKKAVTGGTTTVYIFSGSKVVAEYENARFASRLPCRDGAAPGSPSREYIYSGAALLAKIDGSGTKYYHQDHLSNRMFTDSSGNVAAQMGHFPFGESWYNTANDKLLFTTYERDAETGNDYAQARSHLNRLGRFSSLDPVAGSIGDPQTLNRYTYVRNSPTMLVDPSGMHSCYPAASNIEEKGRDSSFVSGHSPGEFIEGVGADPDLDQLGSGVTTDANTGDCGSWDDWGAGWFGFSFASIDGPVVLDPFPYKEPDYSSGQSALQLALWDLLTQIEALRAVPPRQASGGGGGGNGRGFWDKVGDAIKSLVCSATQPLQDYASATQGAAGVGVGGGAAAGVITGVSFTGSLSLMAAPNGDVGVTFSRGGTAGPVVVALGANAGGQVTTSNAYSLQALSSSSGPSWGPSVGVGPTSVDISVSRSGTGSATLTTGVGVGARVAGATQTTWTSVLASTNCH